MATKDSMNMGSRTSNVIIDVKNGISGWRQETALFRQEMESARSVVSSVADKFRGIFGGGGAVGGGGTNQVAPDPQFHTGGGATGEPGGASIAAGPSTSIVAGGGFSADANLSSYVGQHGGGTLYQSVAGTNYAGGGSGGGGFGGGGGSVVGGSGGSSNSFLSSALGKAGTAVGALFAGYNIAADMMPATSDVLEGQLLQQRAAYFQGPGVSKADITAQQNTIAKSAMLSGDNPQLDVLRAQIAAQSYGLTGGGINNLMQSAANVSNLMPGVGVEGAMRATGSMQQAYSVNMLRGIGIQIRNADGSLKGIDQVIEDIWQKICRDFSQAYGTQKPTLDQVQISLQPGNALDSMLSQYFGSDPMLKQLVANGLIFKAQGGGAINQANLAGKGATTTAMLSYTATAAAGQTLLTSGNVVAGAEAGFGAANTYLQNYYSTVDGVAKSLMTLKSAIDTTLTAFNGNVFSVFASTMTTAMGAVASFLQGVFPGAGGTGGASTIPPLFSSLITNPGSLTNVLPGMATGGEVTASTPYIVGEKGPELFVPSGNGTIVPNDKLGGGNNTYNFTVNVPNGNSQEVIAAIKNLMAEMAMSQRVSES